MLAYVVHVELPLLAVCDVYHVSVDDDAAGAVGVGDSNAAAKVSVGAKHLQLAVGHAAYDHVA